ncbi:MAG TPA: S8 family serine peptidase [Pirellulales bacterium]
MSGSPGAEDGPALASFSPSGSPTATISAVDLAGNSLSTARNLGALSSALTLNDAVSSLDRNDYYKFSVATTADFHLKLNGLAADVDVYLLNSSGSVLAKSLLSGASSEHIDKQLAKGTYYVRVAPYGYAASGYALTLSADLDKAGNSASTAANLGSVGATPLSTADRVGGVDAYDYYKFSVTQSTDVKITLSGLSQNADVFLYDANGRAIASSAQLGTTNERLIKTLATGVYYINVDPVGTAATAYSLTVERNNVATPPAPAPAPSPTPAPSPVVSPLPDVANYGGANDWNLNSINAPESWAAGYTGQGVIVAVIDTGADFTHTELVGNLWANTDEIAGNGIDDDRNGFVDDRLGWDFANNDNKPYDDEGHGTHVAGTIVGERNGAGVTGVAYDATVMAVKVLSASGGGTLSSIASGIRYAVDNGARVINLSLGGSSGSSELQSAIAYAAQHSVLIVAASGNESASLPSWPARYAAQYTNVISVGAYDSSNRLASFSNRVGTSAAVQVDAPGVNVSSSLPNAQFANYSGTSMATPHVAGLAALMLSANASLTAAQLRSLIVATADRVISGSDSRGGIDAGYAVALALNPVSVLGATSAATLTTATTQLATTLSVAAAEVAQFADALRPASQGLPLIRTTAAVEAFFSQASNDYRSRLAEFGSDASGDGPGFVRRGIAAHANGEANSLDDASGLEAAFDWLAATAQQRAATDFWPDRAE